MTDTFATIRGTAQNLEEIIRLASGGYHDEVYLRVLGDQGVVQTLAASSGREFVSYCTFSGLKKIEGDAEAIIPTGLDSDTKGYLDYLGIASGPDVMEMRLEGSEGDGDHPRLASHWSAEGALNTRIRLPASEEDLKHIPFGNPNRWHDGRYVSRKALDEDGNLAVDDDELGEYAMPTQVETTAQTVGSEIIEPADFIDALNHYPVVVEDGELRVELQGNDGDDMIEGTVNAESVEGPDVSRQFDRGFEELFGELTGPVKLKTAPEPDDPDAPSPPLVVLQDDVSSKTVRHILGPFTED